MSLLDRSHPGLSVVFVRYDREKHVGAWRSLQRHLEMLGPGLRTAVVVDNANEGNHERRLNDWAFEIGGDNHAWEFSAFDRGIDWLESRGRLYDLTLLVTDAFKAYGDGFLGLVEPSLFRFCRRNSAAAGWVDSFMEPCSLLGVEYEAWLRTSYLILPSSALGGLRPFAWPLPVESIFSDDPEKPWQGEAPLSSNLRSLIEGWLVAPRDGLSRTDPGREIWHSRFELDHGTFELFQRKVNAILREHHLTTRLCAADVPAYDIRVLSDLLLRGREPASDGSNLFVKGLTTWLSRDTTDAETESEVGAKGDPKLIFAGDLGDPRSAAAVRRFSARVMPLILQRFPRAIFEVPSREPPLAVAELAGINSTFLRSPEWMMDAHGEGVAAVVTVGSMVEPGAGPGMTRGVERIDIGRLSTPGAAVAVAGPCCEALARARERIAREGEGVENLAAPGEASVASEVFTTVPLRWRADYMAWRQERVDEYAEREEYERSLVSGSEPFALHALCYPCGRKTAMHVDFDYGGDPANGRPNWRERLVCQECGLNSKMRAILHVMDEVLVPGLGPRILVWELEQELTLVAQEAFGDVAGSAVDRELPLPHDLESFDCLLVIDMFERTVDLDDAIRRAYELLKPGGGLAFSAAFRSDRERIRTRPNAEAGHAGRVFGWAVLDRFREGGFEDVVAHFFWSPCFGYLGVEQVVFVARKGDAVG